MAAHNELGKWGEQIATDLLESKGWYIRHHDWEYGYNCHGLVCIDSDMTVLLFVIVCTQKERLKKLTNDIVSAASDYVREYHLEHLPVRFDRLIITGTNDNNVITHEENVLPTIDSYSFYEEFRNKQQVIEKLN